MYAERLLTILRSQHHKNTGEADFIMEKNRIDIFYLKKITILLFIINLCIPLHYLCIYIEDH